MRVGVLTGGSDCSGLNAVIRAVVRKGERHYGDELVGLRDGWRGAMEGEAMVLNVEVCRGILPRGGTILGTSSANPYQVPGGAAKVVATLGALRIEVLVVIGGDDTLCVADRLGRDGVHLVGVPEGVDNDLSATEVTFGFHTAVQTATEAIDRLHTTAESHDRVLVCEVIGRRTGWIATYAGIAGGAAEILIPEEDIDIEEVCANLRARHDNGRYASIVVVAEGAKPRERAVSGEAGDVDALGPVRPGRTGHWLAAEIERRTGFETRVSVLGDTQRGGTPNAFDRVLATRLGIAAIDAVHAGAYGQLAALQGGRVVLVPLAEAVGEAKGVSAELYHGVAEPFFS